MANNVEVTAGTGTTFKTTDNAGVHTGHVNIDTVVAGTGATSLGKAEDAVHASGDTGVMALAVRKDTPAALAGADGDYAPLEVDASGNLHVKISAMASGVGATAGTAGTASADVISVQGIASMTPVQVDPRPQTSGGLTIFRSLDLDESEEEVKATAGQVYGMWFSNMATTTRFLKFYNATAANVTVGTTTPVLTIALPGNSSDDISGVFASAHGIAFDTAITVAATTGLADNDTGAPSANDVIVNIFYK